MDCWHHELEKATTEREILQGATDYLQLWAPRGLDSATLGLAELRIDSGEDIERARRALGNGTTPQPASPAHAAHLRELASYFRHAAKKWCQVRVSART